MEALSCYVFRSSRDRPSKKRRLNEDAAEPDTRRQQARFEQCWGSQNWRFGQVGTRLNSSTLDAVDSFIDSGEQRRLLGYIPTSLIHTGSSANSRFFDQLITRAREDDKDVVVTLAPSDSPNLKTALKTLIGRVTQDTFQNCVDDDDENDRYPMRRKGQKLLNYDLQIVQDWIKLRGCRNLVIIMRDSEAFDAGVLSDLVMLLHSWLSRLPVVLLVGIATSPDLFEKRLPTMVTNRMRGELFEIAETCEVLEEAIDSCTANAGVTLHPGPEIASALFHRSKDHGQSLESFKQGIKYAYMSHVYGNVGSAVHAHATVEDMDKTTFEAIRNLPSFKQHIELLLAQKKVTRARHLLQSNKDLLQEVQEHMDATNTSLAWLTGAISVFRDLRAAAATATSRAMPSFSSLYIKALSGGLGPTAPAVRDALSSVRHLSVDSCLTLLAGISDTLMRMPPSTGIDISPDDFDDLHAELGELIEEHGPMMPASAASNASAGATSRPREQLQQSKAQVQYADILARLHELLHAYFSATLLNGPYTSLFCHELLFLSPATRTLWRNALTPNPRAAVERAFSAPHDYLGCACCSGASTRHRDGMTGTTEGEEREVRAGDGSKQPATSILYQLHLESGSLINVADLWSAFRARVSPNLSLQAARPVNGVHVEDGDDMEIDDEDVVDGDEPDGTGVPAYEQRERLLRALFWRGLAELKYLSMVKSSRKKVDCVQKVLWKGLGHAASGYHSG